MQEPNQSAPLTTRQLDRVAETMQRSDVHLAGPLAAEQLAGGRSNLTYLITDGTDQWILRTPPRAGRTPTAHDVLREFRIMDALAVSGVPTPGAVAAEEDESAFGVPFAVFEFVAGDTVRTRSQLSALPAEAVGAVVDRLLEALVALHRVDPTDVGLDALVRPGAYAVRQVRRWIRQWEVVGVHPWLGLAAEVGARLAASVPEDGGEGIVHGDFRIDNAILDLANPLFPRVAAVVDWELAAIGDTVADVAMMCAYRDPAFDLIVGEPAAWSSPEMPDVEQLADAYARMSGAALENWDFHLALARFKIAVIAAGIAHRASVGASRGPGFDSAGEAVGPFLELSLKALDGGGL